MCASHAVAINIPVDAPPANRRPGRLVLFDRGRRPTIAGEAMIDCEPAHVLSCYRWGGLPTALTSLGGAGGFSGARLWRFTSGGAEYCLRRWPREHPTPEGLQSIHRVLARVVARGCDFVPAPLPAADGSTYVDRGGHLWEVSPWMPGSADYHQRPAETRLRNALIALARFHQAAALACDSRPGPAPGLQQRLELLDRWEGGQIEVLARRLHDRGTLDAGSAAAWLLPLAQGILTQFPVVVGQVRRDLLQATQIHTSLQACIRDIWHDHVLFTADRVTGIVDFGSMQVECVATDIARLLGSMVEDDPNGWSVGLVAYQSIQPLTTQQSELVATYDRSQVLLAGLNWLDWIFLKQRQFESWDAIRGRLEHLVRRLEQLARREPPTRGGSAAGLVV